MNNPLLEMIDDVLQQEQEFVIDNDQKAEWALNKIREEQAEAQRIISLCENQIKFYQDRIEREKEKLEHKTGNLKSMLFDYFQTVDRKTTKTQETYTLPSGKLKLKYPKPEFKRDDSKLVEWLENSSKTDYIKIKKSPDWAALKKAITVVGDKVADENGEIVEGVKVVERSPVFDVEV